MWTKGKLCALLVGMQTGAATMESNMELPQKIKNGTACDLKFPLLGIYPKKSKTFDSKKYVHLYVYCSTVYNSQDWK